MTTTDTVRSHSAARRDAAPTTQRDGPALALATLTKALQGKRETKDDAAGGGNRFTARLLRQTSDLPAGQNNGPAAPAVPAYPGLPNVAAPTIGADQSSTWAGRAADAAARAHVLAERGRGSAIDVDALSEAVNAARDAASAASQSALIATTESRAHPNDPVLRAQALSARDSAAQAIDSALEAQTSRATGLHDVLLNQQMVANNAALDANGISNDAITETANRLEAAGGEPATVAALRAQASPDLEALGTADGAAVNTAYNAAIAEAETLGQPALADQIRAAKGIRTNALSSSNSAVEIEAMLAPANSEMIAARIAVFAAEQLDGTAIGERAIGLQRTTDRLDRVQLELPLAQSAVEEAMTDAEVAIEASADAGFLNPVAEARALQVLQAPAGEAASMRIGGTVHEVAAAAADAHGTTNPAAVRAAADAALVTESATVADQILANPSVQAAFKASGKVLTVAAAAALAAQLALAIREDVKNGDTTGTATRHVLAEITGGVIGAEIGAAAGAAGGGALGAAAGSVVPVVGTAAGAAVGAAVGGFIGGVLGFIGGSYAGGTAEDTVQTLVDGLIAERHPNPSQGTLGNLLAAPDANATQLIAAGSSNDAWSNAGELRDGLASEGYAVDASDEELGRMVDAYSSAGNGALSATDLAAAIRDKALVVNADGSVSVDPYQYSINIGSGDGAQAAQAGHIAQRLINLSIGPDGKDDRRINSGELTDSLDAAGYQLADGTDGDLLGRVLNAYDREGDGAVGQQDLTNALLDGAIVIDTDGSVSVNDSRILGQSGGQSANIALRIINAGSSNDAWANHSELGDGFKAAGYDSQLSQNDRDALIARYGKPGVGAVDATGLQRAIDDGALVFAAGGTVRYQA